LIFLAGRSRPSGVKKVPHMCNFRLPNHEIEVRLFSAVPGFRIDRHVINGRLEFRAVVEFEAARRYFGLKVRDG
jgi:hypothetical protein